MSDTSLAIRLVEQHRINRHDPRFAAIDAAAFASKNLYNAALYHTRQAFVVRAERISYPHLARLMRFRMATQIIHRLHRFRRLYVPTAPSKLIEPFERPPQGRFARNAGSMILLFALCYNLRNLWIVTEL